MSNNQFYSLSQNLDYDFNNVELLQQALTHKSFGKSNYERLEFVGDSILDYIISSYLYENYPQYSEGVLSQIRAALVNQDTLASIAREIHLGEFLHLGDGEQKSKGYDRPSILADSLEAIFAAINLDSTLAKSRDVILKLYEPHLKNLDKLITKDSKSLLQEYLQSQKIPVPNYTIKEVTGPDHDSIFNVKCSIPELGIEALAKGKSKKEASQIVAQKLLNMIENLKS